MEGAHARSEVMGQQVKPGWGQSDRRPEQLARFAGGSPIRECHQGQLEHNNQHKQAECKAANPLKHHRAESCFLGDHHLKATR